MKVIELQKLGNKVVLVGAFTFDSLRSKLKFTERHDDTWDPYSPDDEPDESSHNKKYYQRVTQEKRVREISAFIEDAISKQSNPQGSITTIFPSSMILAFDYYKEVPQEEMSNLDLASTEEMGLIVDGQHRFAAMLSLLEKYEAIMEKGDSGKKKQTEIYIRQLLDYKFNCTILLNFDLWEQAQLFATVNFNQKPVNKSLYYDIFGSIPPEMTDGRTTKVYLAHDLTKYLNNSEKSPLKGFIKMLGAGSGFFSQAMLVEAILAHFTKRGVWSNIEEDFRNEQVIMKSLPRIFVGYFKALEKCFPENWPQTIDEKYESILCKTTGMGATVRLLGYIYKLLNDGSFPGKPHFNFQTASLEQVQETFESVFMPISKKGNELFGGDSIYAGTGGAGLQSKLYKQLLIELGLQTNTTTE